ncbi:hypothetical protein J3P95_11350 [Pseudomonas sp. Z5-35]|uniref:hypothetical protein n=1 Tax=unclassified Pseudomonas TaxID=196821 RepID=UPI003DA8A27B
MTVLVSAETSAVVGVAEIPDLNTLEIEGEIFRTFGCSNVSEEAGQALNVIPGHLRPRKISPRKISG